MGRIGISPGFIGPIGVPELLIIFCIAVGIPLMVVGIVLISVKAANRKKIPPSSPPKPGPTKIIEETQAAGTGDRES